MMKTEILGIIAQIVLMVALSYPLGKYIAKVYKKEKTWLDFMKPVERLMFRLSGINPEEEMNWKQFLRALLTVNLFWFVWGMVLLVSQGYLPLNPDGNIGQTCHQAFNTCISFMVNCNLQHYSGESGLTYFTQLFVIVPIHYGSYRHGRNGRDHECPQQEDNQNDWQLLGLPRVEFYPYFAASFSGSWVHPDYAGYANGV